MANSIFLMDEFDSKDRLVGVGRNSFFDAVIVSSNKNPRSTETNHAYAP